MVAMEGLEVLPEECDDGGCGGAVGGGIVEDEEVRGRWGGCGGGCGEEGWGEDFDEEVAVFNAHHCGLVCVLFGLVVRGSCCGGRVRPVERPPLIPRRRSQVGGVFPDSEHACVCFHRKETVCFSNEVFLFAKRKNRASRKEHARQPESLFAIRCEAQIAGASVFNSQPNSFSVNLCNYPTPQ